jgi:hypothetical protein
MYDDFNGFPDLLQDSVGRVFKVGHDQFLSLTIIILTMIIGCSGKALYQGCTRILTVFHLICTSSHPDLIIKCCLHLLIICIYILSVIFVMRNYFYKGQIKETTTALNA